MLNVPPLLWKLLVSPALFSMVKEAPDETVAPFGNRKRSFVPLVTIVAVPPNSGTIFSNTSTSVPLPPMISGPLLFSMISFPLPLTPPTKVLVLCGLELPPRTTLNSAG